MRKAGLFVALLALLGMAAPQTCAAQKVQAQMRPAHVWVPITPLPMYRTAWDRNIACIAQIPGLHLLEKVVLPTPKALLDSVKWFVAGSDTFINRNGREVYGEFFPPDTVVIAGRLLQDVRLIQHELLHVMGWDYHPMVPFKWPCHVE